MSHFASVKEVKVGLNFGDGVTPVGRLARRDRTIYFAYDPAFTQRGLEISPLRLPLKSGVSSFDSDLFEGLPGVFNDSLPDGWGRLLFDRFARTKGITPTEVTPLDRLAHVGSHGMGALVYEPDHSSGDSSDAIRLDTLAGQAQDVLSGTSEAALQELLDLNGSSAGARPKALIGVDQAREHVIHGVDNLPAEYAPWIVKFINSQDGFDAGAIEYVYALMAKEAGVQMPDVHLYPAQKGAGYFSTRRFDRDGDKRFHMHTACGLLHTNFRTPSLDYEDLIALTGMLTRDVREVEKMYRLAVFNVLAHNRDDHAKNFSFLMDKAGQWQLSPAYDLTFSAGPRAEQSTLVMGEGRDPGLDHLRQLGLEANLNQASIETIIEQTRDALAGWRQLAKQYGVSGSSIKLIAGRIL